jgi:hypothetical protein
MSPRAVQGLVAGEIGDSQSTDSRMNTKSVDIESIGLALAVLFMSSNHANTMRPNEPIYPAADIDSHGIRCNPTYAVFVLPYTDITTPSASPELIVLPVFLIFSRTVS